MPITVKMRTPIAGLTQVHGKSGKKYTVPPSGIVTVDEGDIGSLQDAGFTVFSGQSSVSTTTGISPIRKDLVADGRNSDGSVIAAAAAAGKFGVTSTPGTARFLVMEVANNNTKTDLVGYTFRLPEDYIAGQNLTLTLNCHRTGAATPGTVTIDAVAHKLADAGTTGADLVTTAAQNYTASAADYEFNINGATLNPGDLLYVEITMVCQASTAANLTGQLNGVRLG